MNQSSFFSASSGLKSKKTIQTKFRMPLLNWQALKPNQVTGTVFNELDDEQVLGVRTCISSSTSYLFCVEHPERKLKFVVIKTLKPFLLFCLHQELNMDMFEEQFKTRAQGNPTDLSNIKKKAVQKTPSKTSLIDPNKAKNLAITLRKGGMNPAAICTAIETYVLLHFHLFMRSFSYI